MELGLTGRMQKQCKISKLSDALEENLFYCWDINIDKYKGRNVLYIANSNNRLGCIICGMKPSMYKNLEEYVLIWIKELMHLQGYTEHEIACYLEKTGALTITKTHGKKALGAMNQAFMDFGWANHELNKENVFQSEISKWLNGIIGKSAGYNDAYWEPSETFIQDMQAAGIEVEQMKYLIINRITEDDYGCEEREEGVPLMTKCFVASMDGKTRKWIRIPEWVLQENEIHEGSKITRELVKKYVIN
jgi:hypothetical protein